MAEIVERLRTLKTEIAECKEKLSMNKELLVDFFIHHASDQVTTELLHYLRGRKQHGDDITRSQRDTFTNPETESRHSTMLPVTPLVPTSPKSDTSEVSSHHSSKASEALTETTVKQALQRLFAFASVVKEAASEKPMHPGTGSRHATVQSSQSTEILSSDNSGEEATTLDLETNDSDSDVSSQDSDDLARVDQVFSYLDGLDDHEHERSVPDITLKHEKSTKPKQ